MQRTTKDGEALTADEVARFHAGCCPDCGAEGLLEGPHGGLSINVYCGDDAGCGSRFNCMGPFGIERISAASPNKPRVFPEAASPFRG